MGPWSSPTDIVSPKSPESEAEPAAEAPDLRGVRALFLVDAASASHRGRARVLAEALEAWGARTFTVSADAALPDPSAGADILSAVTRFCPSTLFSAGLRVGRDLSTEIPTIHIASVWDEGPVDVGDDSSGDEVEGSAGREGVVLLADPPSLAALVACSGPALPIGPLVAHERIPDACGAQPVLAVLRGERRAAPVSLLEEIRRAVDGGARVVEIGPEEGLPPGAFAAVIGDGGDPYRALGAGIPVIGVSTEERTRARWAAMEAEGLGLGVAWRVGPMGPLLREAVAKAADPSISRRLRGSARRMSSSAAQTVAELLLDLRSACCTKQSGPLAHLTMSRAEFIEYMLGVGPPTLLTRATVESLLEQGEQLGLPWWEGKEGPIYDRFRSWNWIFNRSPAFFEADARAHRATRERAAHVPEGRAGGVCCPDRGTAGRSRVLARPQRYRLTVGVDVSLEGVEPSTRLRAYLPYPLETSAQRDIRFFGSTPDSLEKALVPEIGYIYGAELAAGDEPRRRIEYRAELTISEIHSHGFGPPPPPPSYDASLPAVLAEIGSGDGDPYRRAWLLYDWMLGTGRYEKTLNRCLCPKCSARDFEHQRAGHCIVMAHAFLEYCEAVGVRARPAKGVMFTYPRDDSGQRFGCSVPGEPVIGHTWAEFEVPGVGWLPVEFDPIVIKAASARNCYDRALRERLQADYDFYRAFYFGNLDNQRIVCSLSALDIPYLCRYDPSQPRGARWVPVEPQRLRFTMEVEYL